MNLFPTGRQAVYFAAFGPSISIFHIGSVAIFLLWSVITVHAQPLDTLLAMLPQNNPELKAMNLEYRAALQMGSQVSQLPDPELRLGWYTVAPETRLGPQRLWWILNQKLPWPGKLQARQQLALAEAAPQLEKIAARQLALEQSLKKAWLQLYRMDKLQEVIEDHLEIFDSWEKIALTRVENNRGSSVDVYRLQLQSRELRQRIDQLEIEKSKPQAEINRLLGRPTNATITISGFLGIPELPANLEELLSRISTDHPMFKVLDLEQEISRQALALNTLDRKPDFLVGMDYIIVGQRTDADPGGSGRDIFMPHVGINLPLNQRKYRAKEQEEALKIQALNQRSIDQLNTFGARVESALTEYRRAQSEISFLDEQVYLLRTTIRVAQTDYANDKLSFDELLKLQDKLIDYQERNLAAVVAMHTAMADLQFYLLF